jgi:DNA-binding IclR family transcriptional regulator
MFTYANNVPGMTAPDSTAVKSALRVLDILELLAGQPLPIAHAQIAQALGIPKSSLTGLLRTLHERGYLESIAGGYRLGAAVAALGAEGRRRSGAAETARPIIAQLCAEVGESVGFSVPEGDSLRMVAAANADQPLVYTMRVGNLLPSYATSPGKAVLAHLPEPELAAYLARCTFEEFTNKTVRTAQTLRRQLTAVRRTWVAISVEERHPGIAGLAMAVLDGEGRPLGAINVALPTARFDAAAHKRIVAGLRRATDELARRLAGLNTSPTMQRGRHPDRVA